LDPENPRAHLQANAVAALYSRNKLPTAEDAEAAFNAFAESDRQLRCL
jgi:hypothetical protein